MNIELFILEWSGTSLILIGILFLASKKASNPKIRIKGLIITITGCLLLGIFGFIIKSYGIMITQIGVMIINIYGTFNCKKEIRKCDVDKLK